MNLLSETVTIDRIAAIETELSQLRVEAYLRAGIPLPARHERLSKMVEFAATLFRTSTATIVGPLRSKDATRARFAVMWAAREAYGMSSPVIGREIGQRDHSTVLAAWKRAEQWREEDADYRAATDAIVELFTPKTAREEALDAASSH